MMMKAETTMHAKTTSQMIVEWPRDAELCWFFELNGEEASGA